LLAGFIVERANGQPYEEFLAERIMFPLELTQATVGGVPHAAARGSTRRANRWRPLNWTCCQAPVTSGPPRET